MSIELHTAASSLHNRIADKGHFGTHCSYYLHHRSISLGKLTGPVSPFTNI
jgi:hypothetical protein